MHRNYFGSIERGELNPTYVTLVRLGRGLDMSVADLCAEAAAKKDKDVPAQRRRRAKA